MKESPLVEALRSRDPDAPAVVYDAYAARLYAYCWFRLLDQNAAQAALRDTFIVAEAQIARLRDPADLAPWLYAIARVECSRHTGLIDGRPDLVVARHDQDDVDRRTVAWRSLGSLSPQARELLELGFRHRLPPRGLAAVLELPRRRVKRMLAEAEEDLRLALTAEILARLGPHGCRGRGDVLAERVAGELDPGVRAKLLAHAGHCDLCGSRTPSKDFSPAKVLELSPYARPSAALRVRVMNCFTDPELQGYRLFVATRTAEFNAAGFPGQSRGMPVSAGFFGMMGRSLPVRRNMIA
ncbi:RNA polymerase sigma factor [Actinocorallia populi]|uniref:RNA polymerase sigma factor n=1 Tax=Actinocorallia populi TaxID=2079200 RepID=UPI000D0949A3|nr:sigma-70 family RNA polymerase sigma factor [Actinocorallia populi]